MSSELANDTLRDVLDVAISVLGDYGDDHQNSRIERMANWIVMNLTPPVSDYRSGSLSLISTDDDSLTVAVLGDTISVRAENGHSASVVDLDAERCRQFASALLIGVERSEAQ